MLLLTDRSGAVSAMVQNTRTIGVVEGDGETDNLSMIHVPYDAEIENYQQVLTSGYAFVFQLIFLNLHQLQPQIAQLLAQLLIFRPQIVNALQI